MRLTLRLTVIEVDREVNRKWRSAVHEADGTWGSLCVIRLAVPDHVVYDGVDWRFATTLDLTCGLMARTGGETSTLL